MRVRARRGSLRGAAFDRERVVPQADDDDHGRLGKHPQIQCLADAIPEAGHPDTGNGRRADGPHYFPPAVSCMVAVGTMVHGHGPGIHFVAVHAPTLTDPNRPVLEKSSAGRRAKPQAATRELSSDRLIVG